MQKGQLNVRRMRIVGLLTVLAVSTMLLTGCTGGEINYESTRFKPSAGFLGNLGQCIEKAVAICPEVGEVTADWITQNEPD